MLLSTRVTLKKQTLKYIFSVEGEAEKMYFEWLEKQICSCEEANYNVKFICKVEQNPSQMVKTQNFIYKPDGVIHICDYESNDEEHIRKFKDTLSKLKKTSDEINIKYKLGYCNFTFELWMILHKCDCKESLCHRRQYLTLINKVYNKNFKSLDHYKKETNFKNLLQELTLENVKEAIKRSFDITEQNRVNGLSLQEHCKYKFYKENPSLSIGEIIHEILKKCGLF